MLFSNLSWVVWDLRLHHLFYLVIANKYPCFNHKLQGDHSTGPPRLILMIATPVFLSCVSGQSRLVSHCSTRQHVYCVLSHRWCGCQAASPFLYASLHHSHHSSGRPRLLRLVRKPLVAILQTQSYQYGKNDLQRLQMKNDSSTTKNTLKIRRMAKRKVCRVSHRAFQSDSETKHGL